MLRRDEGRKVTAMAAPIFPLRRVVLPGEQLAIHLRSQHRIWTDVSGPEEFHVTWISREDPAGQPEYASTGTLVTVLGRRQLEAGLSIVGVRGRERVAIEFTSAADSHLEGNLTILREVPPRNGGALRDAAVARLMRYLAARAEWGGEGNISVDIPSEPSPASYRVASLMELSHPERQDLLQAGLAERFERVTLLLERETELLTRTMGR